MNKVAIITGSSRGIGKAIAIKFAENGYNIVINYNNSKAKAETLKKSIESKYKVKTIAVKADVCIENEIINLIETTIKTFGRIDVLVNNAGIYNTKELFDKTSEDFEIMFKTNLLSMFLTTKYASPYMLKNGKGKIVNVSSNNSFQCFDPVTADYDVSKAGVNILTRCMAVELAPAINVNAVAPGWIRTDQCKDLPKEFLQEEANNILIKRIGEPNDVAELVYFLCSDKADYITGEIYRIDGGYLG